MRLTQIPLPGYTIISSILLLQLTVILARICLESDLHLVAKLIWNQQAAKVYKFSDPVNFNYVFKYENTNILGVIKCKDHFYIRSSGMVAWVQFPHFQPSSSERNTSEGQTSQAVFTNNEGDVGYHNQATGYKKIVYFKWSHQQSTDQVYNIVKFKTEIGALYSIHCTQKTFRMFLVFQRFLISG